MAKVKNRAWMTTATVGTGTITLGSAVSGYQSFADAGVANADVVQYVIIDGLNWEVGTGTYTSSGTTLSRTPAESTNADAAISLSGSATVFIAPLAADIPLLSEAQTWLLKQTFSEVFKIIGALEKAEISGTGLTGTLNFDQKSYAVYFSTANATGNWTLNVRGDGSNTLNSRMATGEAITIAVIATQGGTAYYQSAFQIDGSSVTPKWIGGAPVAGTVNSIEMYVFTIIKTASATFTVLGQRVAFV